MPSITTRITDEMRIEKWIDSQTGKTESISSLTKKRLMEILDGEHFEIPIIRTLQPSINVNFWLSDKDNKSLLTLVDKAGASSVGDLIAYMLCDAFDKWKEDNENNNSKPLVISPLASNVEAALSKSLQFCNRKIRLEQSILCNILGKITVEMPELVEPENVKPTRLSEFSSNKVLFAEAGTGVGKTAVYLATAHDFLIRNDASTVFVAVPSFALANQVMVEWNNIQAGLNSTLNTLMLMGQGEFISELALINLLEECSYVQDGENVIVKDSIYEISQSDVDLLKKWVNDGAPVGKDILNGHRWSLASLLKLVPEFKYTNDILLSERNNDKDEGFLSYKSQWNKITNARMVICTHAMLANLVKRRISAQNKLLHDDITLSESIDEWKKIPSDKRGEFLYEIINYIYSDQAADVGLDLLPNIDFLIVDEGHQLEEAFSSAFSNDISLQSLLNSANKLVSNFPGVFSSAGSYELQAHVATLIDMHKNTSEEIVPLRLSGSDSVLVTLDAILNTCLKIKSSAGSSISAAAKASSEYKKINRVHQAINIITKIGSKTDNSETISTGKSTGVGAVLHWSPHKSFPRIHTGRLNCSRELHYLWTNVATRSIVISGTIYEQIPFYSCETIRKTLAVPIECLMTSEPLHAQWQIDPVTLCMIAPINAADGRQKFSRPKVDVKVDKANQIEYLALYEAWLKDIGDYTQTVFNTAKGGLLILGTAYSDITAVKNKLESMNIDTPILCQAPGVTLTGLRQIYLEECKLGKRPILLTVGSAWTGFDLSAPELPDALTDLIILKTPFGVIKKTLSRMLRMSQKTGNFEVSSQVLTLVRQAVGRLVRSPNTPHNRRIHWLDADIHKSKLAGLLSPTRRFLARYKTIPVG